MDLYVICGFRHLSLRPEYGLEKDSGTCRLGQMPSVEGAIRHLPGVTRENQGTSIRIVEGWNRTNDILNATITLH